MNQEWYTWAIQGLLAALGGLIWWDIRRIGRNVHSLRSEVGTIVINLEKQVRDLERALAAVKLGLDVEVAALKARLDESKQWRDMVIRLIFRGAPPP